MQNDAPILFLDTGTLLTLLLGHHEEIGYCPVTNGNGQHDADMPQGLGYASLLLSLAKEGLVRFKITDMVVAEFLGVQAPVYGEDIIGRSPNMTAAKIPNGFQFRKERITLLKELLKTGNAEIVRTKAGDEQLERTHAILQATKEKKRDRVCEEGDTQWVDGIIDKEALRVRLLDSGSKLSTAVRRNNLMPKDGDIDTDQLQHRADIFVQGQLYPNYSDRGEISIADAMYELQKTQPTAPNFILFEGSDVRGRIIQRMALNAKIDEGKPLRHRQDHGGEEAADKPYVDAYHYHQVGKPRARYNPNLPTFQSKTDAQGSRETYVDTLGNFNFLTTKAFLLGLMQATAKFKQLNKYGIEEPASFHILAPNELQDRTAFDAAYQEVIDNVCSNGLPRHYNTMHDEHISKVGASPNGSKLQLAKAGNGHPWLNLMQGMCMDSERSEALLEALNRFTDYRDQESERSCEKLFSEFVDDASKLPPDMFARLSLYLTSGLSEQKDTLARIKRALPGRGE